MPMPHILCAACWGFLGTEEVGCEPLMGPFWPWDEYQGENKESVAATSWRMRVTILG